MTINKRRKVYSYLNFYAFNTVGPCIHQMKLNVVSSSRMSFGYGVTALEKDQMNSVCLLILKHLLNRTAENK